MGLIGLFYPWGIILQLAAVVHFIRRRPDNSWLWVIIVFGPPGALVYIAMEMLPDLALLRQSMDRFGRRKRIRGLEALVQANPSPGNYEELGELYLDQGKYARARECYDKALARPGEYLDAHYRRALALLHLNDFTAARRDLELVVGREPKYDSHRAMALLAHVCAQTGDAARADELFGRAAQSSTLPETSYNYASFLAAQGRADDAREWAERILAHRASMPLYVRRRERPWFRKAKALLKRLPKQAHGERIKA
jgi:hypothetical protein